MTVVITVGRSTPTFTFTLTLTFTRTLTRAFGAPLSP